MATGVATVKQILATRRVQIMKTLANGFNQNDLNTAVNKALHDELMGKI